MATGTYAGDPSGVMHRDTYQELTSGQKVSKAVQFACYNKNPAMRAIGVEEFGASAMADPETFGAARGSGRMIEYESGAYATVGQIFTDGPDSFHVGRLGSYTPSLTEAGDEWGFAWHRLVVAEYIPDWDVMDNGKQRIVDIKAQKLEAMKQSYIRDFNYCVLGNSSAPDSGTMGPSSVYADLPNLISVTQTRTVGGIAATNSYWQNQYKAITSVGGGGDMDRPLPLRRGMLDAKNDTLSLSEASDDFLIFCTQGFWQYYDRLMYADTVQGGAITVSKKYDAAGVQHKVFDGSPMVWDPAVTTPYGATASTECAYFVHIPSFKLSLRSEENFKYTGWEEPREHDQYRTLVSQIRTLYTPKITARRPHLVIYNLPACAD